MKHPTRLILKQCMYLLPPFGAIGASGSDDVCLDFFYALLFKHNLVKKTPNEENCIRDFLDNYMNDHSRDERQHQFAMLLLFVNYLAATDNIIESEDINKPKPGVKPIIPEGYRELVLEDIISRGDYMANYLIWRTSLGSEISCWFLDKAADEDCIYKVGETLAQGHERYNAYSPDGVVAGSEGNGWVIIRPVSVIAKLPLTEVEKKWKDIAAKWDASVTAPCFR